MLALDSCLFFVVCCSCSFVDVVYDDDNDIHNDVRSCSYAAVAVAPIFVVPLFCVVFHLYICVLCLCIFVGPVTGTFAGEPAR